MHVQFCLLYVFTTRDHGSKKDDMHGFTVTALVIASVQAVGGAPWIFAFLLVLGYPQPAAWTLCCYHRD